jgi:hypothetical protein
MEDLKLYQITNGFMALNDNDELTDEEKQEVSLQLCDALQNKSINIVAYYEQEQALLNGIDAQIKRLQEYKKLTQNKINRYKDYVKNNMELLGIEKIETELGKISIAKCPISIEIINADEIPDEYKTIVTEIKVDKDKIKDNFKSTGEIISGVKIITDKTSLRIK